MDDGGMRLAGRVEGGAMGNNTHERGELRFKDDSWFKESGSHVGRLHIHAVATPFGLSILELGGSLRMNAQVNTLYKGQ